MSMAGRNGSGKGRMDWYSPVFMAGGPVVFALGAIALAVGAAFFSDGPTWADAPLALMFLGALMRALGAVERACARNEEKERVARERRAARAVESGRREAWR